MNRRYEMLFRTQSPQPINIGIRTCEALRSILEKHKKDNRAKTLLFDMRRLNGKSKRRNDRRLRVGKEMALYIRDLIEEEGAKDPLLVDLYTKICIIYEEDS